ncbi:MAG TPA: hypothetical protein VFA90_00080 [Terriglobales bacterium]|nr:hypothetical protein [Terriglobales bacterium]
MAGAHAPKISPEMLERLRAESAQDNAIVSEHVHNVSDLRHLAEGIKEAIEINKKLTQRLERRRWWRRLR